MANKHVVIAYYPGADKADAAANQIKDWDRASNDVKLGGVGILTWQGGKLHTRKVGGRATGTGAKWGAAAGLVAGVLSGGMTLIGGALIGTATGAVAGTLFHKSLGLTDDDKARLEKHLQGGGAALVVTADDNDVAATKSELAKLGGDVEDYKIPEETVEKVEAAEEVKPAAEVTPAAGATPTAQAAPAEEAKPAEEGGDKPA
jgi:uncharacterized membrane protein